MTKEKEENQDNAVATMGSSDGFALLQRQANCLSVSSLVPKEYANNISNCLVAINMANRIGADPLQVMQNLHIIHGKPSWSSTFLIATINSCGRFSSLRYEFTGDEGGSDRACRAVALEKESGEHLYGARITLDMAREEGWSTKKGSKWITMPDQMLMYRAAAFWQRAYAPELSMGLHTQEEVADVVEAEKQRDGSYSALIAENPPEADSFMQRVRDTIESAEEQEQLTFDVVPMTGEVMEPVTTNEGVTA